MSLLIKGIVWCVGGFLILVGLYLGSKMICAGGLRAYDEWKAKHSKGE